MPNQQINLQDSMQNYHLSLHKKTEVQPLFGYRLGDVAEFRRKSSIECYF